MVEAHAPHDDYLVQLTGNGILALFGAPAAHEEVRLS
jgi:hypothetical protein